MSKNKAGVTFEGANVSYQTQQEAENDKLFQEQRASQQRMIENQLLAKERAAEANSNTATLSNAESTGSGNTPPQRPSTDNRSGDNSDNFKGGNSKKGQGPDFHWFRDVLSDRGHTEDVINTVTQSGILSAYATPALIEIGKERYDPYIQEYPQNDHAFRGESNPDSPYQLLRLYDYQGNPGGQWHASPQELKDRPQINFADASSLGAAMKQNYVSKSVQRVLALPEQPSFFSEASFTPKVVPVEVSRTRVHTQQVKIRDYTVGVEYADERTVSELVKWLKYIPRK